MKKSIIIALWFIGVQQLCAQSNQNQAYQTVQINTITTGVPFLQIETNAQSYGSGAIGVVAPDIYTDNGFNQNPAHLARGRRITGARFNYVPWLRKLVPDINLFELGGYYSYNEKNIWAASFRYFSLGDITFTGSGGVIIGNYRPSEYVASARYAHYFSEYFSIGGALKYVHSGLYGGMPNPTTGKLFSTAQAIAGDLGFDFRRHYSLDENTKLRWNIGLSLLNIGNKIDYHAGFEKQFLPASLKLGTLFTFGFKQSEQSYIAIDIGYQCEKLLVPTPPIYETDSAGNYILNSTGDYIIQKGYNPNVTMSRGLYQSFYDAPGGAKEEWHEFVHQFGTELRMVTQGGKFLYAARGGYFYENKTKGNRQFYTAGIGFGYCGIFADLAYIIPTVQRHPLANTLIINIGIRTNLFGDSFRFKERI